MWPINRGRPQAYADQMVRGAVVLPRDWQERPGRGLRQGREGNWRQTREPTSWVRRISPRRLKRLHGLRHRDRHSGHDGGGGPSRQGPRATRRCPTPRWAPYDGPRAGRSGKPRAARSSSGRRRPESYMPRWARPHLALSI